MASALWGYFSIMYLRGDSMYTILVCDDEKDIVNALGIYLRAENYQVIEAYNGQEAVDILKHESVDLVVMDIMMPVLDGIGAMKLIRETSLIVIILLTAMVGLGALYVVIMTMGRLPNKEGITLKWYDHLPLEVYGLFGIMTYLVFASLAFVRNRTPLRYIILILMCLHLLNTLIKRLKSGTLFTNSFIYRFIVYIKSEYKNLPLVRKGMITFVVVVVGNWLLFVLSNYTKFLYSSSTKPKVNPYMYVLLVEIIFFCIHIDEGLIESS